MNHHWGKLLIMWITALVAALALPTAHGDIVDDAVNALLSAFESLSNEQVKTVSTRFMKRDYPGNWPQNVVVSERLKFFNVEDPSPFVVAFIHHALSLVVQDNAALFNMDAGDMVTAKSMRQLAIEFMRRFESREGDDDAGTFGYWLYDEYPLLPGPFFSVFLALRVDLPKLGGERYPINIPLLPNRYGIPTDADVTSTTFACLLDDKEIDGGPGWDKSVTKPFTDNLDTGEDKLRIILPWLGEESGTFLTWLYQRQGRRIDGNDVDLVVNANVLFALGRYGLLDTPGVDAAVAAINLATSLGKHREDIGLVAEYYPDSFVLQYCVSRAFSEGGVTALQPSMDVFLDDLNSTAIRTDDDMVYWDTSFGGPPLNTAFAILVLLNGGDGDNPIVEMAVKWLIDQQKDDGSFGTGLFFYGGTQGSRFAEWFSEPFVTGMALEALARWVIYESE